MNYQAFLINDMTQDEMELSDDTDHSGDQELFVNLYYKVKLKFNEFYILL